MEHFQFPYSDNLRKISERCSDWGAQMRRLFLRVMLTLLSSAVAVMPTTSASAGPNGSVGTADTARYQGSLALGAYHGCIVVSEGTVRCWGHDNAGQVGNGTSSDRGSYYTDAQVVEGLSNVASVYAFADTSCALKSDGTVWCWGDASRGTFGIAPSDYESHSSNCQYDPLLPALWCHSPVQVSGLTNVTSLSIGWNHSCAIAAGILKCWGFNANGELGTGVADAGSSVNATPTAASILDSTVPVEVVVGMDSTCILDESSNVYCWGADSYGQLGNGPGNSPSLQKTLLKTGIASISFPMGSGNFCAIESADGELWCWGNNYSGSTGTNTDGNTNVHSPTSTGLTSVVAVHGGYAHTCAVLADYSAKCWGMNTSGQAGVGSLEVSDVLLRTPQDVSVLPQGSDVLAITGGDFFTCAITGEYDLYCWGDGFYGQLGITPQVEDGCTYQESSNFYCFANAYEIDEVSGIAGLAPPPPPIADMGRANCSGNVSWGSPPRNDSVGDIIVQKQMPENGCARMDIGSELVLIWAQNANGQISITPHMRMKRFVGQVNYSITISGGVYSCTGKKFGSPAKQPGTNWKTFTPGRPQQCQKIAYEKANMVYRGEQTMTIVLEHARRNRGNGKSATPRTTTVNIGAGLENI